jgi:hypothetical protein
MYENTNDWRLKSFGVIGDKKVTLTSTLPSAWIVNILEVAVYSAEVWLAFGALCAPIQLNVFPSTRTNPVQPSTCPLQPVSHLPQRTRVLPTPKTSATVLANILHPDYPLPVTTRSNTDS